MYGMPALGADGTNRVNCSERLSPSSILIAGGDCDGRQVVVRGILREGAEMHGLWDSVEAIDFSNYGKKCITTYNPKGLDISGPVRNVDIYGTFHAKRPEGVVILGSCSDAVVEIEKVNDLE
jgi:hypothetical protein